MSAIFKSTKVYKTAFESAMAIFEMSKLLPSEEQFGLTDQMRRSSRSVCANLAEAFRKTRYPKHFLSKLTDADAECSETIVWLNFAYACSYIDELTHQKLVAAIESVGKMLGGMIRKPDRFLQ